MHIVNSGSYLQIVDNSEQPLRNIQNGDGKKVFITTDKGIGMGKKLIQIFDEGSIPKVDFKVSAVNSFLDQGTGCSLLATIASTQEGITEIFLNDTEPSTINLAKQMARENGFFERCTFIDGPDLSDIRGIDLCTSNLPQDPKNEKLCGKGGTKLQVRATLHAGESMTPGGVIISKDVEYAQSMLDFDQIHEIFHVEKLGEPVNCINPNSEVSSTIQYLTLQKKG